MSPNPLILYAADTQERSWPWLVLLFVLLLGAPGFILLKGATFSARKLEPKNPVSYVFHAPIERVRRTIESSFASAGQDDHLEGDWNPSPLSGRGSPELEFDLHQEDLTKSDVYHWLFWPLMYKAEFGLLLASPSESTTQVSVQTSQSQVRIGPNIGGHGGDYYEWVAPTTIEEYRILLKIGRAVGEPGMSALRLPK